MTRAEWAVKHIDRYIRGKRILEVGCGCAEFSIAASSEAKEVTCIDLDNFRLNPEIGVCSNVTFQQMDATAMTFENCSFDTAVMYNAASHLAHIFDAVLAECRRVLRPGGSIWVISSFKIDQPVIMEDLLLRLTAEEYRLEQDRYFTYLCICV